MENYFRCFYCILFKGRFTRYDFVVYDDDDVYDKAVPCKSALKENTIETPEVYGRSGDDIEVNGRARALS